MTITPTAVWSNTTTTTQANTTATSFDEELNKDLETLEPLESQVKQSGKTKEEILSEYQEK